MTSITPSIYYSSLPPGIVIEQQGTQGDVQVVRYQNADAPTETHSKGLLAHIHRDMKKLRALLWKYRPSEFVKS